MTQAALSQSRRLEREGRGSGWGWAKMRGVVRAVIVIRRVEGIENFMVGGGGVGV